MPHVFPNEDGESLILLLSGVEYDLLRSMPAQLRELIEDPDFNNRLVARLFPDAYAERELNREFRTYAGEDIRNRKLEQVRDFERSLDGADSEKINEELTTTRIRLEAEQIDAWLGFTNDMRLMLGTDLGVDSNTWQQENAEKFMRDRRMWLYEFLSQIQCLLLESVMGGEGPG